MRFFQAFSVACVTATLTLTTTVNAQQDDYLKPVVKLAGKINQSAAQSQQQINKITGQLDSKLQQFKAVNKETDGLMVYNRQLRKQIQNQLNEMADLNASIDEVSVIERQITPLMLRMVDGLEQFVKLDVPFLPTERQQRIDSLRELMDRADVALSEKFRRVMEAYQVEMDYGRTIESYSGIHNVGGQERDVDFLRIGRVALIYQTRDAVSQGIWNKKSAQWQELDSRYRTQVTKGLRIAKKQLAPNLLSLPVALTD